VGVVILYGQGSWNCFHARHATLANLKGRSPVFPTPSGYRTARTRSRVPNTVFSSPEGQYDRMPVGQTKRRATFTTSVDRADLTLGSAENR
jgi:hypothetical protein